MVKRENKLVFLDRDGTLIKDRAPFGISIKRSEEMRIVEDVEYPLLSLTMAGFGLVIVTNQSGITRGTASMGQATLIHGLLCDHMRKFEVNILGNYVCPHQARHNCHCRKPRPGMLEKAAFEFKADLKNCWMIGDRASDALAAENCGARGIVVESAHEVVRDGEKDRYSSTTFVCSRMAEAVDHVLRNIER